MSDWNAKTNSDLGEMLTKAVAAYKALSSEEKVKHDYEQRRSFVRGMCPQARDYAEWCKAVDELLPPLKRPAPLDGGWMPIESAPKDGTKILIGRFIEGEEPEIETTEWYRAHHMEYTPVGDGLFKGEEKVWTEGWNGNGHRATHWQPLPAAPASTETTTKGISRG